MRNNIIIFLLALFTNCSTVKIKDINSSERSIYETTDFYELQGNVKNFEMVSYFSTGLVDTKQIVEKGLSIDLSDTVAFQKLKNNDYNQSDIKKPNYNVYPVRKISFDKSGKIIKKKEYTLHVDIDKQKFQREDNYVTVTDYSYKKGLLEKTITSTKKLFNVAIISWVNGFKSWLLAYEEADKLLSTTSRIYNYDSKSRQVKAQDYNSKNETIFRIESKLGKKDTINEIMYNAQNDTLLISKSISFIKDEFKEKKYRTFLKIDETPEYKKITEKLYDRNYNLTIWEETIFKTSDSTKLKQTINSYVAGNNEDLILETVQIIKFKQGVEYYRELQKFFPNGLVQSIKSFQAPLIFPKYASKEEYLNAYKDETYKYEYDTQGNWIKAYKIDNSGNKLPNIFIRNIEYY
ncbi:hypothetical protein QRD02_14160 [Aequorivita sp. SDUM287046]|uniref:Lipoprotein n=1 Tax=Aequorivita aurantiaca TaxID=3053356 RepID=A0ABT8DQL9_9FLAO|nr:hypothetical protein [Aequorivita aurantiaca]MDN3725525.1 hypothetical protein [Aequorivita aurantiaca]